MNAARALRSALFVAPLCLALAPVGDELSFHPKDGSAVSKTFATNLEFGVDDLTISVDGNDVSEMVPLDQAHMNMSSSVSITDTYVKVADGRPTELLRSFDAIDSKVEAGSETKSNEDLEKLEGKKVSFKWNEENNAYDVAYHETEGDAKALEHLAEDMDLRALLPTGAAKEGQKWEVDAKGLMSVVFAGMRTDKFDVPEDAGEMADVIEEVMTQVQRLGDDVKTVCEYKGARDVDGKRCGAIAIKVEGKPSLDLASVITSAAEKAGEKAGVAIDIEVKKATLALELNGVGELVWNLADGHVQTFHLTPNVQINLDVDITAGAQGQTQHVEASIEASGKGELTVESK